MKADIHPKYFTNTQVICACGANFTTGSTVEKIVIEVCKECHPFYTGKQKLVDTAGTLDKFKKRKEKSAELKAAIQPKKVRKTRTKTA